MKSRNQHLKGFLLTITSACIGTCVGMGSYASQAQAAQLTNLVTNGDFANIDPLANPFNPSIPNPFITGWYNSTQNDTFYTNYLENYTASKALENSKSVHFGASQDYTFLSQNLNTKKDQLYKLTYYLANADEDSANSFRVFVGGNLVDEKTNLSLQDFVQYSVNFRATSDITELKFASKQRYAWYNLDDVSVVKVDDDNQQSTSVPEPSIMVGIAVVGLMGFGAKKNRLAKS